MPNPIAAERTYHWLRGNRAARTPRRVITLDSEAYSTFDGALQEQTFRCAVASFDRLNAAAEPEQETAWLHTLDTLELWQWVAERCAASHRTVVFAHNLSYDLRLTEALQHLPALGFEVRQMALSTHSCWSYLSDGKRSLYLIDSLSFLPASLDRIAGLLNRRRPRLPDDAATTEAWLSRCRADVRVLREAMLRVLGLIQSHDLGDFRTTGAAQASAAFRHRFLADRSLLIHADGPALEAERRAAWAGRAEVWRHGSVGGPIYEYDFTAAYATIGRDVKLPVRLKGEFFPANLEAYDRCKQTYRMLCDVQVTTQAPTVPANDDGRILWPSGTFESTLWDCEIELAREHGATVEVLRMWAYESAPLLHEWAVWTLDALAGGGIGADPIGRLMLKDWSRSLIGRFGLRYPTLDYAGENPHNDIVLQPVHDLADDRRYMELQLGRKVYEVGDRVESPNSCPQVMGAVMAEARVRLFSAMQAVGAEHLLSVDTDGLLVDEAGAAQLDAQIALGRFPGLRRKSQYARAELRGPRNIDLDDDRRVAGIPRRAERLAPGIFRGEVWESLPAALRRRRTNRLVIFERQWQVAEHDPRRVHLDNGATEPYVIGVESPAAVAATA